MMKKQHPMVEENDMSVSGDELSGNNFMNNEGEGDENHSEDDETDSENDMLLELTYQQEQAMEQLSAVFNLLKMNPIHDK